MSIRSVWFTDRYGVSQEEDISIETFLVLLHSIHQENDSDVEHCSVSVSDEFEWNLEFYPNQVLFENIGPNGGEIGSLLSPDEETCIKLVEFFIQGNMQSLHHYPWD